MNCEGENGVIYFLNVNVIARLEFELAYYKVAVKYASHYTTENPHKIFLSTFQDKFSN